MLWCRRILQVMIATSRIRIELSKFVKQELHSLANYMHSNLTNQQVTKTITRHFAAKVGFLGLLGSCRRGKCFSVHRTEVDAGLMVLTVSLPCQVGYTQTLFPCLCSQLTVWGIARV